MNNQVKRGYFGKPLVKGKAVGAQRGLVDKINRLCEVLENMTGIRGLKIYKPESGAWIVNPSDATSPIGENDEPGGGSGVPPGYTEMSNAAVDVRWLNPDHTDGSSGIYKLQIKRGKVLVKDVDEDWSDLLEFKEYDA